MINTSAFTAVNTSYEAMKPRSGATTNHHLRVSGERDGKQRSTKVSFGRTMMQTSELLQGTPWDKPTFNCEEIKPIALAVVRDTFHALLCL